jgi:hypothetical protein
MAITGKPANIQDLRRNGNSPGGGIGQPLCNRSILGAGISRLILRDAYFPLFHSV